MVARLMDLSSQIFHIVLSLPIGQRLRDDEIYTLLGNCLNINSAGSCFRPDFAGSRWCSQSAGNSFCVQTLLEIPAFVWTLLCRFCVEKRTPMDPDIDFLRWVNTATVPHSLHSFFLSEYKSTIMQSSIRHTGACSPRAGLIDRYGNCLPFPQQSLEAYTPRSCVEFL
jgi:hypothetical protein